MMALGGAFAARKRKETNMKTIAALLAVLAAFGARAADVSVDKDRMLVVDGKRTFVLGLYENPKDDAVLQSVAKAGFNLVQAKADAAALDRLQANGLHSWINVGANLDFSVDAESRAAALGKFVQDFGGHPSILAWEVPDEALWNVWYSAQQWFAEERNQQKERIAALTDDAKKTELNAKRDKATTLYLSGDYAQAEQLASEIWKGLGAASPHPDLTVSKAPERMAKLADGMLAGYEALKKLDAKHPVWMNHAPRNSIEQLTMFGKAADVVGCDIYPVPTKESGHSDLLDQSLASTGAYTLRMQESAPGKPVWMVLQGFGWSDLKEPAKEDKHDVLKRPTYDQSRFMAYDSIVRGARGILYWGTAYIEKDSQLWQDLLRLAGELNGLQEVLSAPDLDAKMDVTYAPTWGSLDRGVVILPKQVSGKNWLIIANEWREPLTYTLAKVPAADGTVYKDAASGAQATVEQGKLTLTITGNGVHVLAPQ
jgi:hypothetical protein